MNETELFRPIKQYLEGQGYSVHSEVKNCDIAARKGDDLLIIEMKTALSLRLIIQAVKRKELTESVYIAVPVKGNKNFPGSDPGIKLLLRRLEIGLILIRIFNTKKRVEVVFHPGSFSQRKGVKKRAAILREIDGRYAEFNTAGEPSAREKIFAYKQEALLIAAELKRCGPLSPKELRERGYSIKTQAILSKNVYGWFERIERGVYNLHPAGTEALHLYADVLAELEAGSSPPDSR